MPEDTRVHHCVDDLKGGRGEGSAIAICQASTQQSLKTGRVLKKILKKLGVRDSKMATPELGNENLELNEHHGLRTDGSLARNPPRRPDARPAVENHNVVRPGVLRPGKLRKRELERKLRVAREAEARIPPDDTDPNDPLLREDAGKDMKMASRHVKPGDKVKISVPQGEPTYRSADDTEAEGEGATVRRTYTTRRRQNLASVDIDNGRHRLVYEDTLTKPPDKAFKDMKMAKGKKRTPEDADRTRRGNREWDRDRKVMGVPRETGERVGRRSYRLEDEDRKQSRTEKSFQYGDDNDHPLEDDERLSPEEEEKYNAEAEKAGQKRREAPNHNQTQYRRTKKMPNELDAADRRAWITGERRKEAKENVDSLRNSSQKEERELKKRVRDSKEQKAYTEDLGRRVEGQHVEAVKRRRVAAGPFPEKLSDHSPPQGHPASMVPGQPEYDQEQNRQKKEEKVLSPNRAPLKVGDYVTTHKGRGRVVSIKEPTMGMPGGRTIRVQYTGGSKVVPHRDNEVNPSTKAYTEDLGRRVSVSSDSVDEETQLTPKERRRVGRSMWRPEMVSDAVGHPASMVPGQPEYDREQNKPEKGEKMKRPADSTARTAEEAQGEKVRVRSGSNAGARGRVARVRQTYDPGSTDEDVVVVTNGDLRTLYERGSNLASEEEKGYVRKKLLLPKIHCSKILRGKCGCDSCSH